MAKSQETYKEPRGNYFSLFAFLETVSRRDGTLSLGVFWKSLWKALGLGSVNFHHPGMAAQQLCSFMELWK